MNNQFYWGRIPGVPLTSGQMIVASQVGDVTGDGFLDWVFLVGSKQQDSPYITKIQLMVKNGRTNQVQAFILPESAGYDPTIWLGDLTGNGIKDIFIAIDSGGSGGIIFAYVYSSIQGKMIKIFDSVQYNERHPFKVQYANNYKAEVYSENPRKKYTLDLQNKGNEYLNVIYNADGTLKQPIEGWVDPVSALYPVDLARNGKYDLLGMQQIAGRYHADGLGYVENLLHWNGREFLIVRQTVAIYGENL
ncbi:FG-GAP repeat domain-containing protein [Ureibacillus aquaedulcis]|uniref:VCBS repeat-containing protein n=1 Tax=Ureibacillus aquaedulcis TaxID=3058421 RepID=A0ABT8GTT7_9BACL|nr:VCBS repeat-containing protein [Ureibacillus sp. BA0131]MDN4494639.1 VCBS repeat-containing protein [Ureibacillus sp. BA0131]